MSPEAKTVIHRYMYSGGNLQEMANELHLPLRVIREINDALRLTSVRLWSSL